MLKVRAKETACENVYFRPPLIIFANITLLMDVSQEAKTLTKIRLLLQEQSDLGLRY